MSDRPCVDALGFGQRVGVNHPAACWPRTIAVGATTQSAAGFIRGRQFAAFDLPVSVIDPWAT
jgi:hypothetical protein